MLSICVQPNLAQSHLTISVKTRKYDNSPLENKDHFLPFMIATFDQPNRQSGCQLFENEGI
jgi:hypothetical protein